MKKENEEVKENEKVNPKINIPEHPYFESDDNEEDPKK